MGGEMNINIECPRCKECNTQLLATTNQWKYYCPKCDIRFNEDKDTLTIREDDFYGKRK